MLRIHQFCPTLEYVKIMGFEELSQFLKLWIWSNVKIKVIFVYFEPLFFFLGTLPPVTHLSLLF